MKEVILSKSAPAPVGPYSQALRVGSTLYCAGQIPLNLQTGEIEAEDIASQTRQVLENLRGVLSAAKLSTSDVIKTTVFLADMSDYQVMNEVYAQYFPEQPPVRTTVAVAGLPRGARVEIDAIAVAE